MMQLNFDEIFVCLVPFFGSDQSNLQDVFGKAYNHFKQTFHTPNIIFNQTFRETRNFIYFLSVHLQFINF